MNDDEIACGIIQCSYSCFYKSDECLDLSHMCDMDRTQNKYILERQSVLVFW